MIPCKKKVEILEMLSGGYIIIVQSQDEAGRDEYEFPQVFAYNQLEDALKKSREILESKKEFDIK